MTIFGLQAETRFNRLVLGGWWLAVSVLGVLRLMHGDRLEAVVLLISAALTALLGVALSIDRARDSEAAAANAEPIRLQKATALFAVISIATVIGCAVLNGSILSVALECAALVWIVPAAILPLVQAHTARRGSTHAA